MDALAEMEPIVNVANVRGSIQTIRAGVLPRPDDPMNGLLIGETAGTRRGVGYDLDSLREYREGDEARHIDQRATARNTEDKIIVREHTPEVQPRLWMVTDAPSERYRFNPGYYSEQTLALSALVTIGLSAEAQGVPMAAMLANEYSLFAHPGVENGKRRVEDTASKFAGLADQSHEFTAQQVEQDGLNPLDVLLSRAREVCRRNVIVVLSDFRGSTTEGDGWKQHLKALKHAGNFLIAVETTNPEDFTLPEAFSRFQANGSRYIGEKEYPVIAERYAENAAQQQQAIDEAITAAQAVHIKLPADEPRWATHMKKQMREAARRG